MTYSISKGYSTSLVAALLLVMISLFIVPTAASQDKAAMCPPPNVDFTANDTCLGDPTVFTDLSTGDINAWSWSFGDGDSSSLQNPTHTYAAVGTYSVTLTVSGPGGSESVTKTVSIVDGPVAAFTALPMGGIAPLLVTFQDNSIDADTWYWDFDDGNYDSVPNPVHTFDSAGWYDVLLVVTNRCGVDSTIRQIRVKPAPPKADFKAHDACIGDTVHFTDLSTGGIAYWRWYFGDGDSSHVQHPTHVYSAAGTYTVKLRVLGPSGVDSVMKTVEIWDVPTAGFTASPTTGAAPLQVTFTDQSSDADTWFWDFDDGTSDTVSSPVHTFLSAGTYRVMQVVSNVCGVDSVTKIITVTPPPPPVANFVATPRGVCLKDTVDFTDLSTGIIDTWRWDFGDGDTSNVQHPTHVYPDTGMYTVTLTVYGPGGSDSKTEPLYIIVYDGPQAGFDVVPDSGVAPLTVQISNRAQNVRTGKYYFGDGDSTSSANPSHTYDSVGIYTVTQIVENPCGEDTTKKTVTVTRQEPPVANFRAPDTCVGEYILFTDLSTGVITDWHWQLGGGDTSIAQHPTHAYGTPGPYYVTLTVTGPGGSDTASQWIQIWGMPAANFVAVPDSGAVNLTVTFTDRSVAGATYHWDFGDGYTDSVRNPVHIYDSVGTFWAVETVSNMCGTDVDSTEIKVTQRIPPPEAEFSNDSVCVEDTVTFTDLSTGNITSWLWYFGDGDSSIVQNPTHSYDSVKTYTATLIVTGPGGSDTASNEVEIYGEPTAGFRPDPQIGRAPMTVLFTDQSIDALRWLYDLGDGTLDSAAYPTHTYTQPGMYIVTQTVYNDCGEDTHVDSIFVGETAADSLLIFKDVDLASALPGDTLLYTLTVANAGDEVVDSVVVHDTMPDLVDFVLGSLNGYGIASHSPTTEVITWNIGTLAVAQTVQLQFRVLVDLDAPNASVLTNKATITGPHYWGDAFATTNVRAPEVILEKSANPTVAMPGDTITYTVRVVNNGAIPLSNAILVDDLPTDFSYVPNTGRVDGNLTTVTGIDPITISVGNIGTPDSAIITYDCAISPDADPMPVYINEATLIDNGGAGTSYGPVRAAAVLETPPLVIKKTAGQASAQTGSLVRYLIEVENQSNIVAPNLIVVDTMPDGFVYVPGTAAVDYSGASDPLGSNPYEWWLGDLAAGDKVRIEYTVQVTTTASPGINENVAWAHAADFRSVNDTARVNVVSNVLPGKIRGRVIFDCDRDGVPDVDDEWPVGIDVYLDDGSQSRSNEKGMFYFNIVRAGEHAVMLDTRDLDAQGYYLPEFEQSKVFAHVHETGEAYIIFRVCPAHPVLEINKQAAIVPKARATKIASIDTTTINDSTGATVDYEVLIESNGGVEPTTVTLVDSLPSETRLVITDEGEGLSHHERLMSCKVNVGQERMERSVHYSLEDLAPGVRRFITNRVHLEGAVSPTAYDRTPVASEPADVAVGPFKMVPPKGFEINLVGAHFETSKADLRTEAIPVLQALADTILMYDEAEVHAEGHCDYRRIHSEEFPSNWELSFARAKSVIDWLVDKGVVLEHCTWEGFAATRPVDSGRSAEAMQRNRRVEVWIKGRSGPVIDLNTIGGNRWESVTTLELDPVNYLDAFDRPAGSEDLDLDDTWEVFITVENTGKMAVEDALLSDVLPTGVDYVTGTCRIDDVASAAEFDPSGELSMKLGPIQPDQKIQVRYRIRVVPGATPSGGGAASVQVIEPSTSVEYESNEVKFK